jgi:hypothetical protein
MKRHRARPSGFAATRLYGVVLAASLIGGFSTGLWAPAFWVGTAPFLLKLLSCTWANGPGKN